MQKELFKKKVTRDRMISTRVPSHIIGVLRDYKINVSEVINIALRDRLLEEIRARRKK